MNLILWRHADAVDGDPDLARALSPKGLDQAARMAEWLRSQLPADALLIASGARRAQQTLFALSTDFRIEPRLNPGAQPADYLKLASEGTTLIVGHQPEIGRVISLLLTGEDRATAVKKASIWWFSARQGQWALREMRSPEQMT